MTNAISAPIHVHLAVLVTLLLSLPTVYFVISYAYLAWWHQKVFLWNTLIHENGRLTFSGSLFYFDHFIACIPMIIMFALSTVGGYTIFGKFILMPNTSRVLYMAFTLCVISILFMLITLMRSISTVGWVRTINYACQRIERDGIMSRGGSWNQLQLSNIPIALGAIGVSSAIVIYGEGASIDNSASALPAIACISIAAALCVGISAFNWCTFKAFLNARWLAHGIREMTTYPFTGIPIALSSILLVEHYLSGLNMWTIELRPISLILIGASVVIAVIELILLKSTDILAIAQKPAFATDGLSIPYLLCSHVFEHFLDFVFIGPLTGGIYVLVRLLLVR